MLSFPARHVLWQNIGRRRKAIFCGLRQSLSNASFCPNCGQAIQTIREAMDEIQRDHADAHGDVISLTLPMRLDEVEREVILWTLRKTDNNKPEAAQLLGISVKTLYNKLHEYRENTKVL